MKKILFISALSVLFFSCDGGDPIETDKIASGPKIIGFDKKSENIAYFSDEGVKEHGLTISLIGFGDGSLPATNIPLTYEIVEDETSAVEGVEYEFLDSSRTITFPAGSTFTTLPIRVNTGQLNPTSKTELVLKLKSSDPSVTIAEFNKVVKVIFVGCATDLVGSYTYGTKTAIITKISPNVYHSTYMPAFGSVYWFEFSDVCGDLQILDWQYQGGNPITDTNDPSALPMGYVDGSGNLVFEHANVAGVSWYVDLTWTLTRI